MELRTNLLLQQANRERVSLTSSFAWLFPWHWWCRPWLLRTVSREVATLCLSLLPDEVYQWHPSSVRGISTTGQILVISLALNKRKRKRSDSVLWKKAPTPTEKSKKQRDNINTNFDYTTIADRLRTVSWVTAVTPRVWLNRLTCAQPSH